MSRFLSTLGVILILVLCPMTGQAQLANPQPPSEPSAVLQIPVQATMQVDPNPGNTDTSRTPMEEGFNEAPSLFSGHFVGGAGAYLIEPFFQSNPAFSSKVTQYTWRNPPPGVMMLSVPVVSSISRQQYDFCWDLNAAPLVWLGYVTDSGLGVRVRWWRFDQNVGACVVNDGSTTITSAPPRGFDIVSQPISPVTFWMPGTNTIVFRDASVIGEKMGLASNLKLDVWDFEATQEAEAGRWWFLFSGGFRYAHLSQNYDVCLLPAGSESGTDLLRSGHNFNGAGPTLSAEARRPIGNSRFAVYGNVRGSLLFGEGSQRVYLLNTSQGWFGPITSSSQARWNHDAFLPVGEMELGAEYSPRFGWLRPFLRTGLVAQSWFGAGSASNEGGNLGFLGLEVSAGLNY